MNVDRVGHCNRPRPTDEINVSSQEDGSMDSRGGSSSGKRTHSLQPLCDAIYTILISISVLVIRKGIERILTLVILCGISPTSINA